jgi:hypothetical protein
MVNINSHELSRRVKIQHDARSNFLRIRRRPFRKVNIERIRL